MKNVVILHGKSATSQDNWFPWLKAELEKKGIEAFVPDIPDSDKPDIEKYKQAVSNYSFDEDTIIIGHSAGAAAILGVLQNLPAEIVIDKAILVAGFKDNLGVADLDNVFEKEINWDKIKNSCKNFVFIHSDNDPRVTVEEHGKFLQGKLGGELIVMEGQKHFSISGMGESYRQFPAILKYI